MKKINKKSLSVVTTAAMVASVAAPFAATPVDAASSYTNMYSVKSFEKGVKDTGSDTARVRVTVPKHTLGAGESDEFILRLPQKVNAKVTVDKPTSKNSVSDVVYHGDKAVDEGREFTFKVTSDGSSEDLVFFINLHNMNIPTSASGDVKATFEARPGSVFDNGSVVVATTGAGTVDVSVEKVNVITDSNGEIGNILVKTSQGGVVDNGDEIVKLKLPRGFYWIQDKPSVDEKWGDLDGNVDFDFTDYQMVGSKQPRSLVVELDGSTTEASYIELSGLKIGVDESIANIGDVNVTIDGDAKYDIDSLLVAKYGDYSASAEVVGDTPVLLAGKEDQLLSPFVIQEGIGGSLLDERSVTLTLPEGVKWDYYGDDSGEEDGAPKVKISESENELGIDNVRTVDRERRILKFTINGQNDKDDPAKIYLEKAAVAIAPGFSGDLKVKVEGSAGITSTELLLGEVVSPVEASVESLNSLKIGVQNQEVDDIILTEAVAGALRNAESIDGVYDTNGILTLVAPDGVRFASTPKVEVLDGDTSIERVWASSDNKEISIRVNATSDEVSKLKVSNISVNVNRDVSEGDLKLKIAGGAVVDRNIHDDIILTGNDNRPAYFNNAWVSSEVTVAQVVTPAPGYTGLTSVFTIGSTTYVVDGQEKTADIAPFIENARTYLPVRFVADAVGLSESNIIWNDAARTVTLIKGDRIAQLTIGSNILTINGTQVQMDVPATIKNDRTVLPLSFVAQALGADVEWNDAERTVTVTNKLN